MRSVHLAGTALETSALGFGSASLMGKLGRRESVRKFEVAYDSGIRHFDTARAYGYGEAESALGDFLATRRDSVTVTTKLGIAAPRPSRLRTGAKNIARRVLGVSPRLRAAAGRRAAASVTGGHFGVEEARNSLETSLRELRIDTIDLLLLHDCGEEDVSSPELLEFLESSVREGKVRHFGIATDLHSAVGIVHTSPGYARVVQLPNSVYERNLERLPRDGGRAVLTHSAIAAGLGEIRSHVDGSPASDEWSEAVGADCSNPEVLGRLMLAWAVNVNPNGIVLFGSQRDEHIRAAAESISEPEFSAEQIERFAELVASGPGTR